MVLRKYFFNIMIKRSYYSKDSLRYNWPVLIIISIVTALTTIWFWDGRYLGKAEIGVLFLRIPDLAQISMWSYTGVGVSANPAVNISKILITSLNLFLPLIVVQYIVFWSILTIGSISIYKLVSLMYRKNDAISILASFFAALFYVSNPFTMTIFNRFMPFNIFGFALFPLLIFLTITGRKKRDLRYTFFTGLSILPLGYALGHPAHILSTFGIILSILTFFIIVEKSRNNKIFVVKYISLEFLFIFLLGSWWILPMLLTVNNIGNNLIESSSNVFKNITRNLNLSTIFSLDGRTNEQKVSRWGDIYNNMLFVMIPYISPILSALAVLAYNKRKQNNLFIYFIIMMLTIVFLSRGGIEPFRNIMLNIFESFPLLLAYRSPFEKFGVLLPLFYSPLIGVLLSSLYYTAKKYISKYALILLLLPFILINIYTWPMWSGHVFYSPSDDGKVNIPPYYFELADYINNDKEEFRVLVLPLVDSGITYDWNGDTYRGMNNIFDEILDKETIGRLSDYRRNIFLPYLNYLSEKLEFLQSLMLLNIKYIIIPNDTVNIERDVKISKISTVDAKYNLMNFKTYTEKETLEFGNNKNWREWASGLTNINISDNGLLFNIYEKEKCRSLVAIRWFNDTINMEEPKILNFTLKADKVSPITIFVFTESNKAYDIGTRYEIPTLEESSLNWKSYKILIDLEKSSRIFGNADASKVIGIGIRIVNSCTLMLNNVKLIDIDMRSERREGISYIKDFGKLSLYKVNKEYLLERIYSVDDFITVDREDFLDVLNNINPKEQAIFFDDTQMSNSTFEKVDVSFDKIHPTKWIVKIDSNDTKPYLLVFNEYYNPYWQIFDGNINFIDALITKPLVDNGHHFQVNGYANAWYIDKHSSLLTIYYWPQSLYLLGLLISSITIIITILLLILRYLKSFKNLILTKIRNILEIS